MTRAFRNESPVPVELMSVITFPQKQYNDHIMVPGFGALSKYVADNDNVPQDESGQSAEFGIANVMNSPLNGGKIATNVPHGYTVDSAGNTRPLLSGGKYIGLTRRSNEEMRATHEMHDDNVAKWRRNDTFTYRKQQGFEALLELPGYTYLGSPYAKYPHGLEEAARVVSECAGILMERGLRVYCPIAHGHAVSRNVSLPSSWDFWKSQDQPLIDAASAIIVLEMHGWRDSVGLKYETECFLKAGKPIFHLNPSDLRVLEVSA